MRYVTVRIFKGLKYTEESYRSHVLKIELQDKDTTGVREAVEYWLTDNIKEYEKVNVTIRRQISEKYNDHDIISWITEESYNVVSE